MSNSAIIPPATAAFYLTAAYIYTQTALISHVSDWDILGVSLSPSHMLSCQDQAQYDLRPSWRRQAADLHWIGKGKILRSDEQKVAYLKILTFQILLQPLHSSGHARLNSLLTSAGINLNGFCLKRHQSYQFQYLYSYLIMVKIQLCTANTVNEGKVWTF